MTTKKTTSSSVVRTSIAPVRLDQGETVHVDVHKATYSVALSIVSFLGAARAEA